MNTMQQEFDAVVAHLYAQGRPAIDRSNPETVACFYRQPNSTNKCAVGCRIPDAVYTPEMDKSTDEGGTSVSSLIKRFGDVLPPEIKEYEEMFSNLQVVHDSCLQNSDGTFNISRLNEELSRVALRFDLTFTVPQ